MSRDSFILGKCPQLPHLKHGGSNIRHNLPNRGFEYVLFSQYMSCQYLAHRNPYHDFCYKRNYVILVITVIHCYYLIKNIWCILFAYFLIPSLIIPVSGQGYYLIVSLVISSMEEKFSTYFIEDVWIQTFVIKLNHIAGAQSFFFFFFKAKIRSISQNEFCHT